MTHKGRPLQLGLAGVLGAGAALLVACGRGSAALIPPGDAGRLKADFAAVGDAVANGSCTRRVSLIVQTRADLAALPSTLDPRLRSALQSGVVSLSQRAQIECKQTTSNPTTNTNTSPTTSTATTTTNTDTNTTPTSTSTNTDTNTTPTDTTPTNTTPTDTTPTNSTTGVVPDNGGGTRAPNGQTGQVKNGGAGAGPAGSGGTGRGGN